jgi:hypothetical protein
MTASVFFVAVLGVQGDALTKPCPFPEKPSNIGAVIGDNIGQNGFGY